MEIIQAWGGYVAMHVACTENACVRWHGFDFKPWHVGVFAMTRHDLTLVGVVSADACGGFTWWANCHGEFYAENYSREGYSGPDDGDVLRYCGSYGDLLNCMEAAAAFLNDD